jgi:hypothetical protein
MLKDYNKNAFQETVASERFQDIIPSPRPISCLNLIDPTFTVSKKLIESAFLKNS